jgi:hypothetical protein
MAQDNPAPTMDADVKALHEKLVDVLGGSPPGARPSAPYWDTASTDFQGYFEGVVDDLRASYGDQAAAAGGTKQAPPAGDATVPKPTAG